MSSPLAPHFFSALPSDESFSYESGDAGISLGSPSITRLSVLVHANSKVGQSPQPARIKFLSGEDYNLLTPALKDAVRLLDTSKIYPLGVATRGDAAFLPVMWNAGNAWRTRHGMQAKDFYISLCGHDSQDTDRSIHALRDDGKQGRESDCINGIWIPKGLSAEVLDELCTLFQFRDEGFSELLSWVEYAISSHPDSEYGWAQLGDLAFRRQRWKLAMLSFYLAFTRCDPAGAKRRARYTRRIIACGQHTEFGPFLTENELDILSSFISDESIKVALLRPWDPTCELELPAFQPATAITHTHYHVPSLEPSLDLPQLPPFFSWVIPFHLAGMSTPTSELDIKLLRNLNVTHVITLSKEAPLPRHWFGKGIRNTFIPVRDRRTPTIQQCDRALRLILEEFSVDAPGATLVHCLGGIGRTGTVLACYLSLFGLGPPRTHGQRDPPKHSAKRALAVLRELRDGSVETKEQETFIGTYVATAWKRYNNKEPLIGDGGIVPEPSGLRLEIDGDIRNPDMVVLVGVQGSGKSEFTRLCRIRNHAVVALPPSSVAGVSCTTAEDARKACEGRVKGFSRGAPGGGRRVLILDRCNPTIAERREWTKLFPPWGKIVAIYFDYPTSVCISRAQNRPNHDALPPDQAEAAIPNMHKKLEPPATFEAFSGVATVRCLENVLELADMLFGALPMHKFPRTQHLLNLGGATRDDLIIPHSEFPRLFNKPVRVEEKVDGANLGISLSSSPPHSILVQNRSHYVTSSDGPQFAKLDHWLAKNAAELRRILSRDPALPDRYVLFGEWVAATHSVHYTSLPDLFLAFDFYDRLEGRFADGDILRRILDGSGIACVPEIWRGELTEEVVSDFLKMKSAYGETRVEGVVVRWENGERAKIVRPDFIAGDKHWSKNAIRKNVVLLPTGE